jgi:hypothetical protein
LNTAKPADKTVFPVGTNRSMYLPRRLPAGGVPKTWADAEKLIRPAFR